jgi:hypothetical protein
MNSPGKQVADPFNGLDDRPIPVEQGDPTR